MVIRVKKEASALLPSYKTLEAAGADVSAYIKGSVVIKAHSSELIPTGLYFEIPFGYEVQIRPRSGLALKQGLTVLNTPGTIDSDYRGEVKVLLFNTSDKDVVINNGDRIAQAVVSPVIQAEWVETDKLSITSRGTGGYGSTGV